MMKLTLWRKTDPTTDEEFEARRAALRLATGQTDRFVSLCACAVHDKLFTVLYERTDAGKLFAIAAIERGERGSANARANATTGNRRIPSCDVDSTGWRCPHCGNASHRVLCGRCGVTVCGGRTRSSSTGDVFTCRASCGASGTMRELEVMTGDALPRRDEPAPALLRLSSQDRASLPGPSGPRLRGPR